jgi:hypothetical protein
MTRFSALMATHPPTIQAAMQIANSDNLSSLKSGGCSYNERNANETTNTTSCFRCLVLEEPRLPAFGNDQQRLHTDGQLQRPHDCACERWSRHQTTGRSLPAPPEQYLTAPIKLREPVDTLRNAQNFHIATLDASLCLICYTFPGR